MDASHDDKKYMVTSSDDGVTRIYRLGQFDQEKESSVLEQRASSSLQSGKYERCDIGLAVLTFMAIKLVNIFVKISEKVQVPGRPHGSGRDGFYVENDRVLAFRGIAGKDLALIWHMVFIPTFQHSKLDLTRPSGQNNLIWWVFDLRPEHLPLLEEMKKQGIAFLRENREYFRKNYVGDEYRDQLKGKSVEYWLEEENVQFGFHITPTVGYLHLHMLIGPITDFGAQEKYVKTWMSFDSVCHVLAGGQNMKSVRPAYTK